MKNENRQRSATHFLSEEEIKTLTRSIPNRRTALKRQLVFSSIIIALIVGMVVLL
ncbi:hypothetical protein [Piscibacillus salipiscarius]|uniref:Uncharacterized protein n=1 Tax=Piscibacillus salipiscarius TaxID=299480 RepID=A0ABW5QBV4_9BACI